MYILRLTPPNLLEVRYQDLEKYRRIIKRIQALNIGLPQENRTLYYASQYDQPSREFARILDNVDTLPLEEYGLKPAENLRIIVDTPHKLSASLESQTGIQIDFSKPIAALTKVVEDHQEEFQWARLASDWIYFAYPEEMLIASRKDSGLSLQQIFLPQIEKASLKIFKCLKDFINAPEDVESVHQYRVALRSFRALISFAKPLLPEAAYLQLQSIFRDKAQEASRLRELDVISTAWEDVRQPEQNAFQLSLQKERILEAQQLLEQLKDPQTEQELQAGINQFIYLLSLSNWHKIDGIKYLDDRLHSWYRYTLEAFWKMDDFDFHRVHKIRLKSKKYRYISEYFEEYMTVTQLNLYKKAKKRQSDLGDVCDAIRNQEAILELAPIFDSDSIEEAGVFIALEKEREDQLLTKLELKEVQPLAQKSEKQLVETDELSSANDHLPEGFEINSKEEGPSRDNSELSLEAEGNDISVKLASDLEVAQDEEELPHIQASPSMDEENTISSGLERELEGELNAKAQSSSWKWLLLLFIVGMVGFYLSL